MAARKGASPPDHLTAAAFERKKVPLLIVAKREDADFEITGVAAKKEAGWAKTIFGSGRDAVSASVRLINIKTGIVVYSVASDKSNAWRGHKSTAEHCAKNIRQKIEKQEKGKE